MNKLNVYFLLSCCLVVVSLFLLSDDNYKQRMTSSHACCTITVERLDESSALVSYESMLNYADNFELFAEVEYPDDDYTMREQLDNEIENAVNEMQEYCYQHHYGGE